MKDLRNRTDDKSEEPELLRLWREILEGPKQEIKRYKPRNEKERKGRN